VAEAIRLAVSADNRAASGPRLSLSAGLATNLPGERLADLAGRADAAMYAAKGAHYGTGRG
jgi:PleD family two-component response regulator